MYSIPAESWDKFIAVFAETGNLTLAAKAARIGRRTVQLRISSDAGFRRRYDDAAQGAIDLLEAEARRRAVQGVRMPIIRGGKPVAYVRRYSDRLLMLLLSAHYRRRNYRGHIEAAGPPVDMERVRQRILGRIQRSMARRAAAGDPPAAAETG